MKLPLLTLVVASVLWPKVTFAQTIAQSGPANFTYILQADSFAKTKAAAVKRLKASGREWIVLDSAYGGDELWQRTDLDAIRSGQTGRKVIAYISIGEAEEYRSYWRKEWTKKGKLTASAPIWLGLENPDWKGNYKVKYWNAEWQKIILASIEDAMSRGFDGVYLDIIDAFETYEFDGKEYIEHRINQETSQSYRRDMVDWVKTIAVNARAKNSGALIIPQNGSQLLSFSDYRGAISGIGVEDLFTDGDKLQTKAHTAEVLDNLKLLVPEKKPALVIEYPRSVGRKALAKKLVHANGFVWLVTDRQLKTLGVSGQ